MNNTEKLAKLLNQSILQSSEFQAYAKTMNALKKHPEIFEMEKNLKQMQKEILKKRTNPNEDSSDLMKEYQTKKELFESHPLVANYLIDKENVQGLCAYVQEAIEGQLD